MSACINKRNFNKIPAPGTRLIVLLEELKVSAGFPKGRLSSLSVRLHDVKRKTFCGNSLKQLDIGLEDSLNMLKSEYFGAPGIRQGDFSEIFTDFDARLGRILVHCEELVKRLTERYAVLAIAYLQYDFKTIKKIHEQVKQKDSELRVSELNTV
ncbi:hypothetical protein GYMLUDRAFT_59123 [Collybiopsis luxurians FD-317 M1]|uniref:Uncharacterized protein n=1 Tax=Collybiopsis luxurians FD-317 M1 TaxID=944289 RepID=A0A0D0BBR9_9AGAR|nr:hypothetical protein GYMLUDRAFT_59123 [Collybiopsis luxurians FD-317 M1]